MAIFTSGGATPQITYLFIDGGHLQRYYAESVREWFGADGEIDFQTVKQNLGAYKCFYYDCLGEIKRPSEGVTQICDHNERPSNSASPAALTPDVKYLAWLRIPPRNILSHY